MAASRAEEIAVIAERCGFEIEEDFCDLGEMVRWIRGLDTLDPGTALAERQSAALLENLRRVLTRSADSRKAAEALAAQSRLGRWEHLRTVSASGADTFAAVLRFFDIEVPACLLPPSNE